MRVGEEAARVMGMVEPEGREAAERRGREVGELSAHEVVEQRREPEADYVADDGAQKEKRERAEESAPGSDRADDLTRATTRT
jgi:hypothetical protein